MGIGAVVSHIIGGYFLLKQFIELINNRQHGFLRENNALWHSINSKEITYMLVCLNSESANMLLT